VSLEDVDRLLRESFLFLLDGPPCALRETLLDSVRANLMELDALDRNHPVWAFLAVQTVNRSRLGSFMGWKIHHGLADERVYWTNMARDLWAGSRVSSEAWSRLETLSPTWRYEWALLQGFFNFHLFSPGKWMEELKGYLERRDLVRPALDYLRQPALLDDPCVRWLTPGATQQDLIEYAEAIEAVISA
jgi:hypothetical protein